jgi:hypothetical protein
MFPLFLGTLVYQPVDPTPLGAGHWRVALDHIRANTFEYSDVYQGIPPEGPPVGRERITRDLLALIAGWYPDRPVLFYFDDEVVRTALRLRVGLGENTDAWAELPLVSHTGGILDGPIEAFHHLGFAQFGRNRVRKNELTLAVAVHGQVTFYTEEASRGKAQDPTFGVMHRFLAGPRGELSAYLVVKPPLTTMFGVYGTGWDHGFGLTARWQVDQNHVWYAGVGFIRRPKGNLPFTTTAFGRMTGGWGAHGTWEYRRWRRLRPYVQLYAQSGFLQEQPLQNLHRPSLQHDVGCHWLFRPNAALTLRYLNNLTHNQNTADMGLGLNLTVTF